MNLSKAFLSIIFPPLNIGYVHKLHDLELFTASKEYFETTLSDLGQNYLLLYIRQKELFATLVAEIVNERISC